ncbi:hypothetical protein QH494_26770 [Sphingomonas sp. AR_OL41]|uniref:hypothetical protein n=1 Tax=Sphingomonas sp. AR_OL41 TaxID=3042729 RepID=UPI00247FC5DA|nr:hypothetical protein [Sphingomonas sp. AR_OL41]MDH7975803.1 hypothetical protein [Sphingomonas sp. AR_OL41]
MPQWSFLIPLLWVVLAVGISVAFRRINDKPIIPRLPDNARYAERAVSGRSLRSVITRIGGARNCLLVAVTGDRLIVTPFFPFTLMFLPELYGLEANIPSAAIRDVRSTTSMFQRVVIIAWDQPGRQEIELRVRRPDALIAALEAIRRPVRAR